LFVDIQIVDCGLSNYQSLFRKFESEKGSRWRQFPFATPSSTRIGGKGRSVIARDQNLTQEGFVYFTQFSSFKTCWVQTMKAIVFLVTAVLVLPSARCSRNIFLSRPAWKLHLPNDKESIASFVSSLPRGGQSNYDNNDDGDDKYSPNQQQYNDDYYGEDDRFEDGDYEDRGRAPLVGSFEDTCCCSIRAVCIIGLSQQLPLKNDASFFSNRAVKMVGGAPFPCQTL
jgi:hypothetical protein